MKNQSLTNLSRRERQIMDIIYQKGEASATDVTTLLPDEITNSGVRTLLRVLVNKNFLKRKEKGLKYVYLPTIPLEKAQHSALNHLKEIFFDNSAERVMTALVKNEKLEKEDFDKFIKIITDARKKGE
jgi:BlaI family transcriptional regulator, penicillinase repressor